MRPRTRTLGLRELPGAPAARGRCFGAGTSDRAGIWRTWFALGTFSSFRSGYWCVLRLGFHVGRGGGGRRSQPLGGGWPGHSALCGPGVWVFGLGCRPNGRVQCSAGVINILVFMKETRVCVCVYTHVYGLVVLKLYYSYFCCSVAKSCPTLCDPVDCSTPGAPVLNSLPEFAQIYVH